MLSQQMQVFLQVAECGSFTKAARRLLVTPASVMKHINTLEDRLGVTLFKRDKKGVVLTAAGRSLVQDGKKMAALADHAAARAKRAEQEEGIVIRVGSSLLNPSKVLTDLWAPLRTAYPQYKFHIVPYTDTKEERFAVIGALGETFDLLVGTFDSKTIRSRANYLILGDYRLCVAVPEGHPLASKKVLSIQDLHGEHLVKVRRGETERLDHFQDVLQLTHPQIIVEEADYYYDLDTFNACEQNGNPGRLGGNPPLPDHAAGGVGLHGPLRHFVRKGAVPGGVPVSPDPDRFSAGIGAGDSDEQKENRKSAFFALPVFRPASRSVTEGTCVTLIADRGGRSS